MHHILAYMPFGVTNYTNVCLRKKIYTSGQIIAYMLCTSHVLNLPDISF